MKLFRFNLIKFSAISCLVLLAGIISSCHVQKQKSGGLSSDFVDEQLRSAVAHYKILMSHAAENSFPRTWENGELKSAPSQSWISGFYPGTLLYLYEYSGDKSLLDEAEQKLTVLEKEKHNTGTHDLGFMLYCSFGNALRLTGKPAYREVILTGTESLSKRFNPEVGCIRSWGKIDDEKNFLVIIDNMMNLEMMTWASRESGNNKYRDIALTHANTTMANHFRPDYSTWHVVNYNQQDGSIKEKKTAQGNADSSSWARGQVWGLYGYTMMARETGQKDYLEQAHHIAEFLLSHKNLPADGVPYWDFDAPGIPNAKRDASSGSIMASALLELSRLSKGKQASAYKQAAEKIIRSLSSPAYRTVGDEAGGFLLKQSVGALPSKSEVDVPLSYADYYYVEALMRYRDWYL